MGFSLREKLKDTLDDEIKLAGLDALVPEEIERHWFLYSNRLTFDDARVEDATSRRRSFGLREHASPSRLNQDLEDTLIRRTVMRWIFSCRKQGKGKRTTETPSLLFQVRWKPFSERETAEGERLPSSCRTLKGNGKKGKQSKIKNGRDKVDGTSQGRSKVPRVPKVSYIGKNSQTGMSGLGKPKTVRL